MLCIMLLILFCVVDDTAGRRYIKVVNRNSFSIWIENLTNNRGPPLSKIIRIRPRKQAIYKIKDSGWAGRLWAKIGCNKRGKRCSFGQSEKPCLKAGCHPPADTKVEFYFPPKNAHKDAYYDISLVDGFSLASEIIPYKKEKPLKNGACKRTNCRLHLKHCPKHEHYGVGNLAVKDKHGKSIACLAPCKKWNFPYPYGLNRNENQGKGKMLCCPPGVRYQDCRKGIIVKTKYVKLLRKYCPSAYSYSYDDVGGLHNCPADTSFVVHFYS